jgi:hypothetical protein
MKSRTLALSVESIRKRMLEGVRVPPEMVTAALEVTKKKLEAKTTKFFVHQGTVTATVDVDDHEIQLKAAEQIYKMSEIYAHDTKAKPAPATVAMEVDPLTGVIRIVVGGPDLAEPEASAGSVDLNSPIVYKSLEERGEVIEVEDTTPDYEVVNVPHFKKGELPPAVRDILYGNG